MAYNDLVLGLRKFFHYWAEEYNGHKFSDEALDLIIKSLISYPVRIPVTRNDAHEEKEDELYKVRSYYKTRSVYTLFNLLNRKDESLKIYVYDDEKKFMDVLVKLNLLDDYFSYLIQIKDSPIHAFCKYEGIMIFIPEDHAIYYSLSQLVSKLQNYEEHEYGARLELAFRWLDHNHQAKELYSRLKSSASMEIIQGLRSNNMFDLAYVLDNNQCCT
jgi:hypothetical protein